MLVDYLEASGLAEVDNRMLDKMVPNSAGLFLCS